MFFVVVLSYGQNNLASSKKLILRTESSAIPWDLAQTGIEYPVDLGLWVYNKGTAAQTNVDVNVEIEYGGGVVYTNTSSNIDFLAPDTTWQDTQYVDLGVYVPSLWSVGTYTITYSINNTNDDDLSDNVFSFDFKVTNNDDVYSKCRLDSLNRPMNPGGMSVWFIFEEDQWRSCLAFRNSYAGQRNAEALGMTFSAYPTDSLTNKVVEIIAYQWDDVFIDIYSPSTYNNLTELSSKQYIYPDESQSGVNIYLSFDNPIQLQDDQRYLFCLYNNNGYEGLIIGADNQIDYTSTSSHYAQPLFPVEYSPGNPSDIWFEQGFGWGIVPAISVTMDIATGIETNEVNMKQPYPNPVSSLLNIPIRRNIIGKMTIELYDMQGKLLIIKEVLQKQENLKLNVASIPNGNYLLKVDFLNQVGTP